MPSILTCDLIRKADDEGNSADEIVTPGGKAAHN